MALDLENLVIPSTLCSNMVCGARLGCNRAHPDDYSTQLQDNQKYVSFENNPDGTCDWFILRGKLKNESDQFRAKKGSRRKRHNAHAPPSQVSQMPKSTKTRGGQIPRMGFEPRSLKQPDLMVSRHIKHGKDIKQERDADERA